MFREHQTLQSFVDAAQGRQRGTTRESRLNFTGAEPFDACWRCVLHFWINQFVFIGCFWKNFSVVNNFSKFSSSPGRFCRF
jgi:hypothetical protein